MKKSKFTAHSGFLQFHKHIKWLVISIFVFESCSSYTVVPNGFIIRGDDNFVSLDKKMSVFLGPVLTDDIWNDNPVPVSVETPSRENARLLKKFGYNKNSCTVLFTSYVYKRFDLIGLTNTETGLREFENLIEKNNFQTKSTKLATWYNEIKKTNNEVIYHAIIPFARMSRLEKYITLIYMSFDINSLKSFEKLLVQDTEAYQNAG